MCGEKRDVSEQPGRPAPCEEKKTPVREKPAVSHKRGRLRGNGSVHQSKFTGCEKTPSLKKNHTFRLRSAPDGSDAQKQKPEVQQSTAAEDSSALLSRGLKPTSNLEDQTLHVTVRLQEGEEEEKQDEETSGLINSHGEVVEWGSK